MIFKKYEFWHPRVFELPFYIYLGWQCLIKRIGIKTLAKANYALDHGEIGLGSKLKTQFAFDQHYFLPSDLIESHWPVSQKSEFIKRFAQAHGYPIILKSNMGCVGKAIVKVHNEAQIERNAALLLGDFIVQKFTAFEHECGVFYVRHKGVAKITGINKKHFPTVRGNGIDSVQVLAEQHPRYTAHWDSFLQNIDTDEVLAEGQEKRLSFIGSHTLGCKFTDDTSLLTAELETAVFKLFESQPGFNFGRVDLKFADDAAFQRGEFVVIEVNGVASLPTHMFDPNYSVWQAYAIFFEHARYLASIAREHRHQAMPLLGYREVIQKVGDNARELNEVHQRLMGKGSNTQAN